MGSLANVVHYYCYFFGSTEWTFPRVYQKPERGIRQGNPLSPFLFILCAEALVHVLNRAEVRGRLHGVKLAAGSPSVHHLLFADDSLLLCEASVRDSEEIVHCLKIYGDASGQLINTSKSSIIFGDKIATGTKQEIKGALGIEKKGGEGSYLGLPECFKGSKVDLLNFIKEKLEGRLQGWYSKTLSMGAKEVLIKSVALALPIYAMSVFKLPKGLCERITSAIIEFWWSSGDKKRKISWVSWEKLCKPKEHGGLGFHDIGRFNQDLLGKQAWRIWSNPDSLVSRVLKGKYFKNGNFLDCGMGTRPSYAWRSIMHGRELLKKGLVRHIGNGMESNVWIIDTVPRPPMYMVDSNPNLSLKVSDLFMQGSNHWNVNLLHQTFTPQDVQRILLLKPSLLEGDSIRWGFTTNRFYSSRSGYKFSEALVDFEHPHGQSLTPIEKQLWRDLWKIKAPPKVKHFMWRALSGALAVKQQLNSRGIPIDPTCSICGNGEESICHALFLCPRAHATWMLSNFPIPSGGFSWNFVFLNFVHLIKNSKTSATDTHTKFFFPWILWKIWKARNAFVFENKVIKVSFIAKKAYEEESTWFDTFRDTSEGGENVDPNLGRWKKPPNAFLKCNVGSSWVNSNHICGASWILRDSNGRTIIHSRHVYSCMRTRAEADIWSHFWAVECLHNLHFSNIIFEAASENLREVMLMNNEHMYLSHIRHSISYLLSSFDSWSLDHALPERNEAAAAIALSVTRDQRHQSYIARNAPVWLHRLLSLETQQESV